jgi:hypothetical protein
MKYTGHIINHDDKTNRVLIQLEEPLKPTINKNVTLKTQEKHRSLSQNNFYWLFITFCLPYYQGYDPDWTADMLHEHFKAMFLTVKVITKIGAANVIRSTSGLRILQFCDFMEQCFYQANTEAMVPVDQFVTEYENWKSENIGKDK